MTQPAYRAHITITRERGPLRTAILPATEHPVEFGVHSAIAEHYGVEPDQERATTIDYLVAAAGG